MVNNTDHIIKVAIYSRVSTQEQADTNTSLDFQNGQLTNYCHLQGWEIFQNYVDPGFTGKDGNRPALKRMLADAKLGLFNRVLVIKLDRLSRNLRLLLEIEETLKQSGVSVASIKESIDTSVAIGRTVFQVLGLVSEWERDNIIERTKSGRIQRYKEGGSGPGNPPYGYKFNRTTKKLDISEQEARVVRIIFQEYALGKSMTQVANFLNTEKIPSRNSNGKGWRNTAIRDVLINTVYKGSRIVNVYQKSKSFPELLPDTAIKIAVPAIIDDSVWNTVQDRRKTNKHLQPVRKEKYLLQGLITCECGHTFQITLIHGRRTYGCRGRLKYTHLDDSPRCTIQNIDAVWIEEQVWQRIEVIINDPNKLKKLIEDTIANLKNRESELSARIKPIDERLSVIADQKARLAEEWFQINLNPDKWNELKRNLEQEETRLKSVRGEIDPAQIEELEHTRNTLLFWMVERDNIVKWNLENEDYSKFRTVSWPHDDVLALVNSENKETAKEKQFPGTRRDLLDFLQVRLMVFTDRIEIKAIFPIEPIKNQLFEPDCMSARCRQSL